jgi:hypothetical protein
MSLKYDLPYRQFWPILQHLRHIWRVDLFTSHFIRNCVRELQACPERVEGIR